MSLRTPVLPRAAEKLRSIDLPLLLAVLFMAGFGVVMVLSASGIMAEKFYHDTYRFFTRQVAALAIGLVAMIFCAKVNRQFFYKYTYFWLVGAVVLLLLTASPLGVAVNGARRWLRLGPLSFQALEVVKIALVFYLAYFFSTKQDKIKSFSIGVIPPFVVTGSLAGLLLLQPDMGGAALLCGILFMMSMVGGTRLIYLLGSLCFATVGAGMLVVHKSYRMRRLLAFLDPFKDAQDVGYQLVQSLYAFGSGGVSGVGLGAGNQKLFYLPEAHTDFLMAVVGEEIGFVGVSMVMVLVGIIIWRGFAIAMRQADLRDRFVAYGMTLILGLGFLLNLAVVLGTVPPKGVPMPFFSYGGSQMIASCVCVGILLNLSRRQEGQP